MFHSALLTSPMVNQLIAIAMQNSEQKASEIVCFNRKNGTIFSYA